MKGRLSLVFLLTWLASCGGHKGKDVGGIEVGNPSIGVSTRFDVSYGMAEYPTLIREASSSEPLVLDNFLLDLWSVRVFSSYYFTPATYYDPLFGNQVWPEEGDVVPARAAFVNESDSIMPEILVTTDAIFKEVQYELRSPQGAAITGNILTPVGMSRPFRFQMPSNQSWSLRYLRSQVEDLGGGRYDLQVRFHVPQWIYGLDLGSVLVADSADTVVFSEDSHAELWDSLTLRLPFAFGSAHVYTMYDNGDTNHFFAPGLLEKFQQPGTQLVRNASFADGLSQWYVINQMGGVSDHSVSGDTLRVNVIDPGSNKWSVQLIQEDIPLVLKGSYVLTFEAGSSEPANVAVRTGMYYVPYSSYGLQKTLSLDTVGRQYRLEFTNNLATTFFARLEFNLSGAKRSIWIRNIRLEPLAKR